MIKYKNRNYLLEYLFGCLLIDFPLFVGLFISKYDLLVIVILLSFIFFEIVLALLLRKLLFSKIIILDDRIIDVSKKISIDYSDIKKIEKYCVANNSWLHIFDYKDQKIELSYRKKIFEFLNSKINKEE